MAGSGGNSGVAGNTLDAPGATVVADVLAAPAGIAAVAPDGLNGAAGLALPAGGFVAQSSAPAQPSGSAQPSASVLTASAAPVASGTGTAGVIPSFQIDIGAGYSQTPLLLPNVTPGNQVVAISTDGVSYTSLVGGSLTLSGPYLSMTALADGMMTVGVVVGQQQAAVDALATAAAPVVQSFYYQLANGGTYQVDLRPDSILPAALGEQTVPLGSTISLAALTVDVALATGQISDQSDVLAATVFVGNGTLAIDPTLVGAAANTGETVTANSPQSISITGTVAQVNAELMGLTYSTSGTSVAGNDPVTLAVSAGAQSTSNVVGVIDNLPAVPGSVGIGMQVYGNTSPTSSAITPTAGTTVTGISTDGVGFTAVSGTDASFATTPSVAGQYLTLAMNADGSLQLAVAQGGYASVTDASNAAIDAINNAQNAAVPPTDNFYYRLSDGSIHQIAVPLSDLYVPLIAQPGFQSPLIVSPNSTQLVAGLRIDQALVAGQTFLSAATTDQGQAMSVTVDPFDYTSGVADGTLNIPTVAGGATVTADGRSGVTITGTVAQIDSALAGLTYSSGATANDSITLSASAGAQGIGPQLVGSLSTSIGSGGATGGNSVIVFAVDPTTSGYPALLSIPTGTTVTAISNNDAAPLPVTGTDPTFTTSASVTGLNGYLSLAVNADGTSSVSVAGSAQALIDAVNANDTVATPLSESFYTTLSNGVTDQLIYQLSDVSITTNATAPFASPETVAAGSSTTIAGVSVSKALSTGQSSNGGYVLTVTISLFDFTTQSSEGSLSINAALIGAGGNIAKVATAAHGGITITDSISAINADLQGLTYTAGNAAAKNSIVGGFTDGPVRSSGGLIGTLTTSAPACYGHGTLIGTPAGACAIDSLSVGDLVLTASGGVRPVRWIGYRAVECAAHPDPAQVWPVRVAPGAFGEGMPARELWLSPGHNVVAEDMAGGAALVPICALINGRTVAQHRLARTEYWHVELDAHDIILAEGLPAESYLDTGNRAAFANGADAIEEHPDFGPRHWSETCLPLLFEGPVVEGARAALLARAAALGHALQSDGGVHVLVDGRRVAPVWLSERRAVFMLPEGGRRVRLRSRRFVPAHTDPASGDQRVLGVCVGRLQIDGEEIDLGDEALFAEGWHGLESWGGGQRWTEGDAALPAGSRLLMLDLIGEGRYWMNDETVITKCSGTDTLATPNIMSA